MRVVDSSVWLNHFKGGAQADLVAEHLHADVLVPTVVLYEVYRVLLRDASEDVANEAAAWLTEQQVVPLDEPIALAAADLSLSLRLPMADAVVYATAQAREAVLVTCNKHFANLPGVEYIASDCT